MAKLTSNLLKIAQNAPQAAAKALQQTGNDIASLASQLAPVDTGALKKSIRAEHISDSLVLVGSDVEYAPHQEYGTYKMSAQPFLTPAFRQSEETFKQRLKEAVSATT